MTCPHSYFAKRLQVLDQLIGQDRRGCYEQQRWSAVREAVTAPATEQVVPIGLYSLDAVLYIAFRWKCRDVRLCDKHVHNSEDDGNWPSALNSNHCVRHDRGIPYSHSPCLPAVGITHLFTVLSSQDVAAGLKRAEQ